MTLFRRTARIAALGLMAGALAVTAQPAQAASITEGFDDITTLTAWRQVDPGATAESTPWRQGDPTYSFPAHSGAADSYIAIDYRSGDDNKSSWLITPQQTSLSSTDVLSFWTRSDNPLGGGYPDRLEVRMSTNGSCSPGTTTEGVGDFTTLLGSINPELADDGYPVEWTQYSLPLTGLSTTNVSGCLAFRYFVTDTDTNGEYIGIDSLAFTDNASVACTTATATAGGAQATVASATATLSARTQALATTKKALKKTKKAARKAVRKAVKKAKRSGDDDQVKKARKKAKKKVRKAKKAVKKATASVSSSTAALATAQAALATAQTSATASCP